MKITIDTEQKTIKLEGQVKLSELIRKLDEMGVTDEFEIVGTEKEVEYVPYYPIPSYPANPWEIISETVTRPNISMT